MTASFNRFLVALCVVHIVVLVAAVRGGIVSSRVTRAVVHAHTATIERLSSPVFKILECRLGTSDPDRTLWSGRVLVSRETSMFRRLWDVRLVLITEIRKRESICIVPRSLQALNVFSRFPNSERILERPLNRWFFDRNRNTLDLLIDVIICMTRC